MTYREISLTDALSLFNLQRPAPYSVFPILVLGTQAHDCVIHRLLKLYVRWIIQQAPG